jgi:hypothetical protein
MSDYERTKTREIKSRKIRQDMNHIQIIEEKSSKEFDLKDDKDFQRKKYLINNSN